MDENIKKNDMIAYEMAKLVKENRMLRERLSHFDRILYTNHNKKDKGLFDAPHDIPNGSKIVITESRSANPKFPKGFVLNVKNVCKNDRGYITIYGEYQRQYDVWSSEYSEYEKQQDMRTTAITNKNYNWRVYDGDGLSALYETDGGKVIPIRLIKI